MNTNTKIFLLDFDNKLKSKNSIEINDIIDIVNNENQQNIEYLNKYYDMIDKISLSKNGKDKINEIYNKNYNNNLNIDCITESINYDSKKLDDTDIKITPMTFVTLGVIGLILNNFRKNNTFESIIDNKNFDDNYKKI
jgi:hypothetical protein